MHFIATFIILTAFITSCSPRSHSKDLVDGSSESGTTTGGTTTGGTTTGGTTTGGTTTGGTTTGGTTTGGTTTGGTTTGGTTTGGTTTGGTTTGGTTTGGTTTGGTTGGGSAPLPPTGMTLSTPVSSPGTVATPIITVSGVTNGDVIKIFSNSTCSTQVGSATSSGSSVNVTTSSLIPGAYTFYANSTNGYGTSTCSSASVSYSYAYANICTSSSNRKVGAFLKTDSGNISPLRTIITPVAPIDNYIGEFSVDSVNGEIFLSGYSAQKIFVYDINATSSSLPKRTLNLSVKPNSVFVDPVNNEILVAGQSGFLKVYSRTAQNNDAPLRTISGANTQLGGFLYSGIINTTHNEIYVLYHDNSQILVFNRTANGNIAPIRTISGANTGINAPNGMVYDTQGDRFIVNSISKLLFFPRTASGNVTPTKFIYNFDIQDPSGAMAIDYSTGEIYVQSSAPPGGTPSILVFPLAGSGTLTPTRSISGALTEMQESWGISLCP